MVIVGELPAGKLNVTFFTTIEFGEALGLIRDFTVTAPSCAKAVVVNNRIV
jgi:hypothetical protein